MAFLQYISTCVYLNWWFFVPLLKTVIALGPLSCIMWCPNLSLNQLVWQKLILSLHLSHTHIQLACTYPVYWQTKWPVKCSDYDYTKNIQYIQSTHMHAHTWTQAHTQSCKNKVQFYLITLIHVLTRPNQCFITGQDIYIYINISLIPGSYSQPLERKWTPVAQLLCACNLRTAPLRISHENKQRKMLTFTISKFKYSNPELSPRL